MTTQKPPANRHYLTVWRWHFYAGLFTAPFLMLLAATGLAMLLFANITGRDGERMHVTPQAVVKPLSEQAEAARQAINPDSASVVQYIAPRQADMVAVFRVNEGKTATMVAIDPYTAQVMKIYPRNSDWYHLMDEIHSDILIGKTGDFLLETAAALTILLIITGYYLWISKQGSLKNVFSPNWAAGAAHGAVCTAQWAHGLA